MALDIDDDFDVFDNTEVITYQRRSLSGTVESAWNTVVALPRAVRGSFLPGVKGALISSNALKWHIKASSLPVEPRKGDRLISTSLGTWEVSTDDIEAFQSRYVVHCKNVT